MKIFKPEIIKIYENIENIFIPIIAFIILICFKNAIYKNMFEVIKEDENVSINCFPKDLITEIISKPAYLNTYITSPNIYNITVGNKLIVNIYLFDYRKLCIDNKDYSKLFDL